MDIAIEALAAQAALDPEFPGDMPTLVSFLVNALYLFGGQSIAAPGAPAGVTAELTRLGHRVARILPESENRPGRGSGRTVSGRREAGRLDRIFLARALGFEADPADRLRALRRALRPGGLLCFHLLDRDRAWERTGIRSIRAGGAPLAANVDFDPVNGRLVARVPGETVGMKGSAVSAQTWNLAEVKGLLQAAGLELERAYGDWDGGGPGRPSGSLIVVAAKPLGGARRGKGRYSSSASTSSSSASNSSGSSAAIRAATLSTRFRGEKGLARNPAKASPTSSTTPSVAP